MLTYTFAKYKKKKLTKILKVGLFQRIKIKNKIFLIERSNDDRPTFQMKNFQMSGGIEK